MVLVIIVIFCLFIVFAIFGAYNEAKESTEEGALGKFWRNFGIATIIILSFCAYLGYKYQNEKSERHYYHNSKTGKEQIQYQGSQEQQQDLKAIDDYSSKHTDF